MLISVGAKNVEIKAKFTNVRNVVSGGLKMGNVMMVYKVMPEGQETDLEKIKTEIKDIVEDHGTFKGSNEEKVAFGLKAIITKIVIPDEGGIVDEIEEELKNIDEVQSVSAEDVTLID